MLLERCLAKDRKARIADVSVVQFLLNEPIAAATAAAPSESDRGRRLSSVAWMLPSLVALVAVALVVWQWTRPSSARVVRLTIPVGDPAALRLSPNCSIAISSDGTRVVYRGAMSAGASTPVLMQRKLDEFTTTPLAGTEGASGPFFSPDGRWVGFFTQDSLKKISINGGAALTISRRSGGTPRGAVWAADDTIYFADTLGAIQRVPSAGGTPQPIVRGSGTERPFWPQLLPDGKSLLFVSYNSFNNSRIYAQSLDGGERHLVAEGGSAPHYVATGYIVYGRPEGLLAIPFDSRRLQATGSPRPLMEGVTTNSAGGCVEYALSAAGTLVYVPGAARLDDTALVWVDRRGTETSARAARGGYSGVQLSPDGTKLALQIQGATADIWIDDLTRDTRSRLTFEGNNAYPTWTPDGKRVTYQSQKPDGSGNIYWKPADGSGPEERLTTTAGKQENPNSWTADGRVLAVETTGGGLEYVTLDPKAAAHALLESPWNKDTPRLSWDGKWLGYASEESGALQVYVQPFPSLAGKWQISTDGGTAPRWKRDGRELYYMNAGKLMVVTITTEPSFAASKPILLFQGPYVTGGPQSTYDVTADGQRFLMIKQGEQASVAHLNVVLNWFQELKK